MSGDVGQIPKNGVADHMSVWGKTAGIHCGSRRKDVADLSAHCRVSNRLVGVVERVGNQVACIDCIWTSLNDCQVGRSRSYARFMDLNISDGTVQVQRAAW